MDNERLALWDLICAVHEYGKPWLWESKELSPAKQTLKAAVRKAERVYYAGTRSNSTQSDLVGLAKRLDRM